MSSPPRLAKARTTRRGGTTTQPTRDAVSSTTAATVAMRTITTPKRLVRSVANNRRLDRRRHRHRVNANRNVSPRVSPSVSDRVNRHNNKDRSARHLACLTRTPVIVAWLNCATITIVRRAFVRRSRTAAAAAMPTTSTPLRSARAAARMRGTTRSPVSFLRILFD